MKLINSLGFLFLGLIMAALPEWMPGLCPPDIFGNSVRATWLHLMGFTQVVIGATYLVRKAGAEMALWLERWPELLDAETGAPIDPVPQGAIPVFSRKAAPVRMGEVIPVDFKPAWSDQRAA